MKSEKSPSRALQNSALFLSHSELPVDFCLQGTTYLLRLLEYSAPSLKVWMKVTYSGSYDIRSFIKQIFIREHCYASLGNSLFLIESAFLGSTASLAYLLPPVTCCMAALKDKFSNVDVTSGSVNRKWDGCKRWTHSRSLFFTCLYLSL
jgi:hypothetical protein